MSGDGTRIFTFGGALHVAVGGLVKRDQKGDGYALRVHQLVGFAKDPRRGSPNGAAIATAWDVGWGELAHYVASYDPDGNNGFGDLKLTTDLSLAKIYSTQEEAITDYNRRSTVRPLRPDGEPNKPLTAYTAEIITVGRRTT